MLIQNLRQIQKLFKPRKGLKLEDPTRIPTLLSKSLNLESKYWCSVVDRCPGFHYKNDFKKNGKFHISGFSGTVLMALGDGSHIMVHDQISGESIKLNRDAVVSGLETFFRLNPIELRAALCGGKIPDGIADMFLQYCLFGKVRYRSGSEIKVS